MTDRPAKQAYERLLGYVKYNTLNKRQGPTVNKYAVITALGFETERIDKAIEAAKNNNDLFEIDREMEEPRLTLFEESRLLQIQENEAKRKSPNKSLIGHINQMREKT